MTDAVRPDAASNPAGNSGGGNGGEGGAGGAGGGSGGKKGEKKKCGKCGHVHHTQVACWEVCALCGKRHHYRASCQRVPDPQRSLVEENRALHERNRALEQELAQVRGQLHTQMQITNLLQQQAQGSVYSSPFSLPQPAMQPQALQAPSMQPPAWEQPKVPGSFSGFRRPKQATNTRSGPPQAGKGSEGGGADATKRPEKKEVVEQPKKMAEASKEKIAELRKKQAEAKKQSAEKKEPSSTPADKGDQAASTDGKKPSRGQRRRENRMKAEEKKKEGALGNTEAMEVDEEAQAPTSTGPDDGGEEGAEVSTLAFRERSSEGEAGAVDPQPQPQPQQASAPADNSVSGVVDGNGAASGPSKPRQPEK